MKPFAKLADKLLITVLRARPAAAGCPPDCYYTACQYHSRQYCCYNGACTLICDRVSC